LLPGCRQKAPGFISRPVPGYCGQERPGHEWPPVQQAFSGSMMYRYFPVHGYQRHPGTGMIAHADRQFPTAVPEVGTTRPIDFQIKPDHRSACIYFLAVWSIIHQKGITSDNNPHQFLMGEFDIHLPVHIEPHDIMHASIVLLSTCQPIFM